MAEIKSGADFIGFLAPGRLQAAPRCRGSQWTTIRHRRSGVCRRRTGCSSARRFHRGFKPSPASGGASEKRP